MPRHHEYYSYGVDPGPDWEGFQGFIGDREEIDRLAEPLRQRGDPRASAELGI